MTLLTVDNVSKSFGGLRALKGVSLSLDRGQIVGLIGANGSGKTTLFEVISGFQRPDGGQVLLDGHRIDGVRPDKIFHLGVARTFQILEPLHNFTVFNSVLLGCINKTHSADAHKQAAKTLELLGLDHKVKAMVGDLSIAEQRRLELARALAPQPKLVLLDEVMSGLTDAQAKDLLAAIQEFNRQGISFLLVEHVMRIVMQVCQRIVVLHFGEKIAEGTPAEVAANERVIQSYLGDQAVVTRS